MASNKKRSHEDDDNENALKDNKAKKKQRTMLYFDTDAMTDFHTKALAKEQAEYTPQMHFDKHYRDFVKNWNKLLQSSNMLNNDDAVLFDTVAAENSVASAASPIRVTLVAPGNPFGSSYLQGSVFGQFAQPYSNILSICCNYFEAPSVIHAEKHVLIRALKQALGPKETWEELEHIYGKHHPPAYRTLLDVFKRTVIKRIGKATKAERFAKILQAFLDAYILWDTNTRCFQWLHWLDDQIDNLRLRWHEFYDTEGKLLPGVLQTPSHIIENILLRSFEQRTRPIFDGDAHTNVVPQFRCEWIRLSTDK
jgi:hypothetical protein